MIQTSQVTTMHGPSCLSLTHVFRISDLVNAEPGTLCPSPRFSPSALDCLEDTALHPVPLALVQMAALVDHAPQLLHDTFALFGPAAEPRLAHLSEIDDPPLRHRLADLSLALGADPLTAHSLHALSEMVRPSDWIPLLALVQTRRAWFVVCIGSLETEDSRPDTGMIELRSRRGRLQGAWIRPPLESAHARLVESSHLQATLAVLREALGALDPLLPDFDCDAALELCLDHLAEAS